MDASFNISFSGIPDNDDASLQEILHELLNSKSRIICCAFVMIENFFCGDEKLDFKLALP